jgi:DNA-binding CsgD family transcriptional regulator
VDIHQRLHELRGEPVLVGRKDEQKRLDGLITGARGGQSAALVVHGEPGIGKTSLLEYAVAAATGFKTLRARPLEAESELAFAGLSELLRTILHMLVGIPGPQCAALAGALALGPPAPGDRFAVAAATLSLLAAAAEEAPLLAVVDDAHWLDTPSREALLFAGRRLGSEGLLLLFGMRQRAWISSSGLETLELRGLHAADAAELLQRTKARIDGAVRSRLVAETRGNPLAILEAVATLTEAELLGKTPITHPLAVSVSLERAFGQQLDGLPRGTRRALLIAAASDTGASGEIARALVRAGLRPNALEAAERNGVIAYVGERIEFRHPLVRSAAYHLHDPVERRAAHRVLAAAIGSRAGERAAWHMAAASAGPDEEVAALLETSAISAFARNAYAAAASAFETAAVFSPDDDDRLRRMICAGRALWLGGEGERAAVMLEGALDLADEPTARADVQELRGLAMLFSSPVSETHAMLVAEANRIEPQDPARAAALLANAALTRFMAGDLAGANSVARRAVEWAGHRAGPMVTMVLAHVRANLGEVDEALTLLEPLLESLDSIDPLGELSFVLSGTAQSLVWIERWAHARRMFDRVISAARLAGAPAVLTFPLALFSEFELRRGKIAAAYATAAESVQLAAETGQTGLSCYSLVTLARVEAILGHDEDCRAHVADGLELARRTGSNSIEIYAAAALGLLELSRSRPDRAALRLTECAGLEQQYGTGTSLPTVTQWAADLVEAQIRSGAIMRARRSLAVLEEKAMLTGLRWAHAGAARCRGMLAAENCYEWEFETALALYGEEMAFERARTQLAFGMRHRRSRRRADARAVLHAALAYFERCGAEPWAEQARAELRASGDMPSCDAANNLRSLTAQELQVAMIVAQGSTTREAAAALFLSPKTVEFHLGNTYRKLGLRSRAELVRRVEGLK